MTVFVACFNFRIFVLQSSPKEDHNTFRTTPQEHWWI